MTRRRRSCGHEAAGKHQPEAKRGARSASLRLDSRAQPGRGLDARCRFAQEGKRAALLDDSRRQLR